MKIRAFTEEDILQIAELEKRCFSDPWPTDAFLAVCRYPVLYGLLAEEDGKVVGYCCTQVLFEEAELQNIAVAPELRGKGIAGGLLAAAEENAKSLGAERCFLEVRVGNTPAIRLYEKFGYETIGIRKGYYEDGEDAGLMRKTF